MIVRAAYVDTPPPPPPEPAPPGLALGLLTGHAAGLDPDTDPE